MKSAAEYKKHIYWLTEKEESHLRREQETHGVRMQVAKGIVCSPLDEISKISSVPPGVWSETCPRAGHWYRASDRNGLFLVITSLELEGYKDRKAATITRSELDPPRLATREEKRMMVGDPDIIGRIPAGWKIISETEKKLYLRWARRLGSDVEDYDSLYLSHTANHANFIKPRFFVKDQQAIIPYSVDISAHLCSCCLELFQILGSEFPKKLVRPCPGATIFARLKPDQYLLVEKG